MLQSRFLNLYDKDRQFFKPHSDIKYHLDMNYYSLFNNIYVIALKAKSHFLYIESNFFLLLRNYFAKFLESIRHLLTIKHTLFEPSQSV